MGMFSDLVEAKPKPAAGVAVREGSHFSDLLEKPEPQKKGGVFSDLVPKGDTQFGDSYMQSLNRILAGGDLDTQGMTSEEIVSLTKAHKKMQGQESKGENYFPVATETAPASTQDIQSIIPAFETYEQPTRGIDFGMTAGGSSAIKETKRARVQAALVDWAKASQPEAYKQWEAEGIIGKERGFVSGLTEKGAAAIPIVGPIANSAEYLNFYKSIKRLDEDNYENRMVSDPIPSAMPGVMTHSKPRSYSAEQQKEDDQRTFDELMLRLAKDAVQGNYTIGSQIGRGIAELPDYLVAYLATGGVAGAGSNVFQKTVLGKAKKIVGKKVTKQLINWGAWPIRGAIRAGASPHILAESALQKVIPAGLEISKQGKVAFATPEAKNLSTAIATSYLELMAEFMGEETGEFLTPRFVARMIKSMKASSGEARFIKKVVGEYSKANPGDTVRQFFDKKLGVHSFFGEMGEETVTDLLGMAFGVTTWDEFVQNHSAQGMMIKAGVLAVPTGIRRAAGMIQGKPPPPGTRVIKADSPEQAQYIASALEVQAMAAGEDIKVIIQGKKVIMSPMGEGVPLRTRQAPPQPLPKGETDDTQTQRQVLRGQPRREEEAGRAVQRQGVGGEAIETGRVLEKPKEVTPPTKAAKEPWEMTTDEYVIYGYAYEDPEMYRHIEKHEGKEAVSAALALHQKGVSTLETHNLGKGKIAIRINVFGQTNIEKLKNNPNISFEEGYADFPGRPTPYDITGTPENIKAAAKELVFLKAEKNPIISKEGLDDIEADMLLTHSSLIEQAVKEGKKIPINVLKEQAKYGNKWAKDALTKKPSVARTEGKRRGKQNFIDSLPIHKGGYRKTIKPEMGIRSPVNSRDVLAKTPSGTVVRSRSGGLAYPVEEEYLVRVIKASTKSPGVVRGEGEAAQPPAEVSPVLAPSGEAGGEGGKVKPPPSFVGNEGIAEAKAAGFVHVGKIHKSLNVAEGQVKIHIKRGDEAIAIHDYEKAGYRVMVRKAKRGKAVEPTTEVRARGGGGFVSYDRGGGKGPTAKVSAIIREDISAGTEAGDDFLKRTKGFTKGKQPGPLRRAAMGMADFVKQFKFLEKIPSRREYADIREKIRHTVEIARLARSDAIQAMEAALIPTKGIALETRKRVAAIEQKIIADDLNEEITVGNALPPGLMKNDVKIMKQKADALYDKYPSVRKTYDNIVAENKKITDMIVEMGWMKKEDAKEFYFPHKVIKYLRQQDDFGFGIPRKPSEYKKGYLRKRKGGADYSTDVLTRLIEHWADVRRDVGYAKFLQAALKDEQSNYFNKEFPDWKQGDPVPSGYREVTVLPGRFYYRTHGVTEDLATALMEQNLNLIEATLLEPGMAAKVREVLAVGKKRSYVVREPIARQLADMPTVPISTNGIYRAVKNVNTFVKGQILFNPLYAVPFHSTNFMGDAHKALVALPSALHPKYLVNYWQEIINAHQGKKSKRFEYSQKKGVVGSGWIGVDVARMKTLLPEIERAEISGAGPYLASKLKRLWNLAQAAGAGREDWLRYCLFERLLDLQEKGKDITKYAVKDSKLVKGISDPIDKAAKVARDIMGDYAAIGKSGQMMSEIAMPFYRWMHINTPWWPRMIKEYAGKGQSGRLAYAIAAASAPYILANLWNYSDEDRRRTEESLPPWKRWNLHINTGKDKIHYMPLPLDDVLNFFGIPEHITDFQRYNRGEINQNELVWRIAANATYEPAMSVVNMIGGVAGVARDAVGLQTFPDFRPYLSTNWKIKGWRMLKDIFGAPAQLGEAQYREQSQKVKDLLWRSVIPFARAYTNDIVAVQDQLRRSTYKKPYKREDKTYPAGHAHKGKERRVDILRAQLRHRKDIEPLPNFANMNKTQLQNYLKKHPGVYSARQEYKKKTKSKSSTATTRPTRLQPKRR